MAEQIPAAPAQSPVELKAQIEAERAGKPFLIYRDGPGQQQIFTLTDDLERVTVGRETSAGIWIDWDTEVSRLHAELERIGESWTVSDDGLSRNGTHVNGERVVGRRRLRDRDQGRLQCDRPHQPVGSSAARAAGPVPAVQGVERVRDPGHQPADRR